ncbi:MAG: OsmC family protein [Chloroflexota bacterium]|jgi:putative redox protein
MAINATVTFQDKVRFEGWAESGHKVIIDGPQEAGGENAGFRPMELMLLGLGGCMSYDVNMILKRMRQKVTAYRMNIEAERADEPPRVYTQVKMEHLISGENLNPDAVQRAIDLAESTYCSGSAMFAKTAKIINTFKILDS